MQYIKSYSPLLLMRLTVFTASEQKWSDYADTCTVFFCLHRMTTSLLSWHQTAMVWKYRRRCSLWRRRLKDSSCDARQRVEVSRDEPFLCIRTWKRLQDCCVQAAGFVLHVGLRFKLTVLSASSLFFNAWRVFVWGMCAHVDAFRDEKLFSCPHLQHFLDVNS